MTRRLALASVLAATLATPALAEEVVVFAAASLKDGAGCRGRRFPGRNRATP
jgi:ABC-type molybdate transport system substrate-binding protein